jgi:hypothetical protein
MLTHLGVDEIPDRYILKRWTQKAVSGYIPPAEEQQPDVMPAEAQKQVRHANMNMSFLKLARIASTSDEATAIVNKHICAAATKVSHMNKLRKKKTNAGPSNSAPDQPPKPRDPPKTTTKGRAKSKRTMSALELHPKRKVTCHSCGSIELLYFWQFLYVLLCYVSLHRYEIGYNHKLDSKKERKKVHEIHKNKYKETSKTYFVR